MNILLKDVFDGLTGREKTSSIITEGIKSTTANAFARLYGIEIKVYGSEIAGTNPGPEAYSSEISRRAGSPAVNDVIDTVTPVSAAPSAENTSHESYVNVLAFHKEAAEMIINTQVERPDLDQYTVPDPDQGQFTQQQYELAG